MFNILPKHQIRDYIQIPNMRNDPRERCSYQNTPKADTNAQCDAILS